MNISKKWLGGALFCMALAVGCGGESDTSPTSGEPDAMPSPESEEPECTENSDCEDDSLPYCSTETQMCEAAPAGGIIGWGDGSADSVMFELIHNAPDGFEATGLEFHPERADELWVARRRVASTEPCTGLNPSPAGCQALEGSITIIFDPTESSRRSEFFTDPNAWHFMRRPPGLAFGVNDTFATCGEERTGNFLDGGPDFMGPTLWSADLDVFAKDPGGGLNGSHLDMLHETPFCMGIAHEADNIYWLFNGNVGSLDKYNFNDDHGPGADDHSDGEVYRYAEGELGRVSGVPSHMVFDKENGVLYVADTGNSRIVRFNPEGAEMVGEVSPINEPLLANGQMEGGELMEIIPSGVLDAPSGLAIHEDVMYVSDNATSKIHAFDMEGNELRSLETPFPEGSLSGITIGPDNRMYLASLVNAKVYVIDPNP